MASVLKKRILFTCTHRSTRGRTGWLSILALITTLWWSPISAAESRTCPLASSARIDSETNAHLVDHAPSIRLDRQCYVSAELALTNSYRRASLFVDIRDATAFSRAHIEHSINIPARELANKGFLHDKEVVLVGAGPSHRELERACASLRSRGFRSVHVLDGGVSRWRATIGPLAGSDPLDPQLDAITVTDYVSERRYDHWLEVIVTVSAKHSMTALANALIIPSTVEREEIVARLRNHSFAFGRDREYEAHILIVHDRSDDGRALVQAARRDGLLNVYSLHGGATAWLEYARMRTTMARYVPRSERLESCAN